MHDTNCQSRGKNLLKHYAKEAKKYKATLVFRGLPNGSWQELATLVAAITDENRPPAKVASEEQVLEAYGAENRSVHKVREDLSTGATTQLPSEVEFGRRSNESGVEMQIDDEMFERFNIKEVPTVVLSLGSKFDKVSGNVGIKAALELMKKEGELQQEAAAFLPRIE